MIFLYYSRTCWLQWPRDHLLPQWDVSPWQNISLIRQGNCNILRQLGLNTGNKHSTAWCTWKHVQAIPSIDAMTQAIAPQCYAYNIKTLMTILFKNVWYGPLRTKLEPFSCNSKNFEPYEKGLHYHHFQRMVLYLMHCSIFNCIFYLLPKSIPMMLIRHFTFCWTIIFRPSNITFIVKIELSN